MKNSARYARKIKPLLSGAKKVRPPEEVDLIHLLVEAVLAENATVKEAASSLSVLLEEFVDFNELRVSPIKDIVECLGRDFPGVRTKAVAMTGALNVIFARTNALSMEYLASRSKREIRRALREKLGLSPYVESVLTLYAFQGHAVPVDNLLLEALKLDKCIHPDSDLQDLQGFLERIILSKDGISAHEALRAYASGAAGRVARELARRARKAEAEARAKAEAEAKVRAKAEAKAKAKAEAKAKVEAARKKARRKAASRKAAAKKAREAGKPRKAKKAAARKSRPAAKPKKAQKAKRARKSAASKTKPGKRAKK